MVENPSKEDILFMQLVWTFQSAAWQYMGKVKNPITDKIERNLDQARYSIDILEMLMKKTEGNLTENENQLIHKAITELQLNFVAETDKEKKEKEAQQANGPESSIKDEKKVSKEPRSKKYKKSIKNKAEGTGKSK